MRYDCDYIGYTIYCDGVRWVAETTDEDDDFFLHMRSVLLERVIEAIDDIHACDNALPPWLAAVRGTGANAFVNLDIVFGRPLA